MKKMNDRGFMFLIKSLFAVIVTLIAVSIASLPVLAGYGFWNWINPETEMGRIALGGIMLLFGGGLTFFIWFLTFTLWTILMASIVSD